MVGGFSKRTSTAVVVVCFDVSADSNPPIPGGHTCTHALSANVGHTFMKKPKSCWLENGGNDD